METTKGGLNLALFNVQSEIEPIIKDSENPHYKSKYFDINTLLATIKPVFKKHLLLLMQSLVLCEGRIGIKTRIVHGPTGEEITETFPLPECSDAQKYGSAITYFRRYALQSLLALEAEDDDGNSAKPDQIKQKVEQIIKEVDNDLAF